MAELYKRKPNTICVICKKPIYKRPFYIKLNQGRVFCSQSCYGVSCRKEKACVVCGKLILAGLNKRTCGRACANTNRAGIKYHVGSPRDKVKSQQALKLRLLKERGNVCERCGYSKYEILQVHHKNRDRKNNSLENLEFLLEPCCFFFLLPNKGLEISPEPIVPSPSV